MKKELGPRKIRIFVSKSSKYDFDIYRMANLRFQLVDQQSSETFKSSKIRFRRKVGSCETEAPPGLYSLRLTKFKFNTPLAIDKDDADEVTVTIRISGSGISLKKS